MEQTSRASGRRRVVAVTAALAGAGLAGTVGLAVIAGQTTADATTSTSTTAATDTAGTGSTTWQPSTTGVTSGSSGDTQHATSGGS